MDEIEENALGDGVKLLCEAAGDCGNLLLLCEGLGCAALRQADVFGFGTDIYLFERFECFFMFASMRRLRSSAT